MICSESPAHELDQGLTGYAQNARSAPCLDTVVITSHMCYKRTVTVRMPVGSLVATLGVFLKHNLWVGHV